MLGHERQRYEKNKTKLKKSRENGPFKGFREYLIA